MKRHVLVLLIVIGGFSWKATGQDLHYSQFNSSPQNINPALTGLFDGFARVVFNQRSQWGTITTPYTTFSGNADMKLNILGLTREFFSVGVNVNSDQAGDSKYKNLEINLAGSYTKSLSYTQQLFASIGAQVGYHQRTINYGGLNWDRQFDGDIYDPTIPSGENLINTNTNFFDYSGGLNFFYSPEARKNINLGVSMFHISQPNISLQGYRDVTLPGRLTAHLSASTRIAESIDFIPGAIFQRQGTRTEIVAGAYTKFILEKRRFDYRAIYIGYWFRARDRDAFILSGRIDYHSISFGMSYDINISDLAPASKGNGGFEFSLIYVLQRSTARLMKKYPCPNFI